MQLPQLLARERAPQLFAQGDGVLRIVVMLHGTAYECNREPKPSVVQGPAWVAGRLRGGQARTMIRARPPDSDLTPQRPGRRGRGAAYLNGGRKNRISEISST